MVEDTATYYDRFADRDKYCHLRICSRWLAYGRDIFLNKNLGEWYSNSEWLEHQAVNDACGNGGDHNFDFYRRPDQNVY